MDRSNYSNIISLAKNKSDINKVMLLLDENNMGGKEEVPDPYYDAIDGFEHVFHLIDTACDAIAKKLETQ